MQLLVNKMDEVTVKWNKERFDIQTKLGAYLNQCGFGPKDVDWYVFDFELLMFITLLLSYRIPISGIYGQNLKDRYVSK